MGRKPRRDSNPLPSCQREMPSEEKEGKPPTALWQENGAVNPIGPPRLGFPPQKGTITFK